jgi:hypothetical protein
MFHAQAFKSLSTDKLIEKTKKAHLEGTNALGLIL